MTLAQKEMASMPTVPPGGSGTITPELYMQLHGVTPALQPHYRKLKEEEEKIRANLAKSEIKVRAALREWERLDRESEMWHIKSEASAQSLQKLIDDDGGSY